MYTGILFSFLAHDPAIALLGIYPKGYTNTNLKGHMHPMFIAALSTIVKLWKESKRPLTDEWIKKIWYICNGLLLSHLKE